jgi:lipopolysaccharide assembly protein A
MTEPAPHAAPTLPPSSPNGAAPPPAPAPPASANGSAPPASAPSAPSAPPVSAARRPRRGPVRSRIGAAHIALIAGAVALIVVLVFIIENAHTVTISFFGAHLRVSLAVALLVAAIGGALIMAAAGTARITQLRLTMRRSGLPPHAE